MAGRDEGSDSKLQRCAAAAGIGDELRVSASVVDRGFDLRPIPDDPGIGHGPMDVVLAEVRDRGGIESGECVPEVLPLAENSEPAQAQLKALQAELLEQRPVIGHGPAPLAVVVRLVEIVIPGPPAARASIGSDQDSLG